MDRKTGLTYEPMFGNLSSKGLKLIDILIYFTIASFEKTSNLLIPTYKEIGRKSGCSLKVVIASIKRLSRASLLNVIIIRKHIKKQAYELINNIVLPHDLPAELFQATDLRPIEKATLLLIATSNGGCPYKIALSAGISILPFKRTCQVLQERHYLIQEFWPTESNQWEIIFFLFDTKIDWETFQDAINYGNE